MFNQWVMDAWKRDERISGSFRQCGYFDFDGGIDELHLKLRDTINDVLYNLCAIKM